MATGGNRGLGYATSGLLAEEGVSVIVGSRDQALGAAAADRLRQFGHDATSIQIDVTSDASVRQAAAEIGLRHGRLDILINNAGVLPEATAPKDASAMRVQTFQETFDTNLFGVVRVVDSMLPLLRKAAAATIVNVSSTTGSLTDQTDSASPYFGIVVPPIRRPRPHSLG